MKHRYRADGIFILVSALIIGALFGIGLAAATF